MPAVGKAASGRIVRHGFYQTKFGKRRRYRCRTCRQTFCANTGTPYHRLQHRRATFDEVAALSVEGLDKSAIARVKRIAWNTVDRWFERAADSCHRFNNRSATGLAVEDCRLTRFARLSVASNSPSGSSPRSTSGLGSGLRRSSGDGTTETRSFETLRSAWIPQAVHLLHPSPKLASATSSAIAVMRQHRRIWERERLSEGGVSHPCHRCSRLLQLNCPEVILAVSVHLSTDRME